MTDEQRRKHNEVQKASYQRRKARRAAGERISELEQEGITATTDHDTPTAFATEEIDLDTTPTEPIPIVPQPDDEDGGNYQINPGAGGLVVVIDDAEDYDRLAEKYPHPEKEGEIDLDAMADDGIHGIHLTPAGHASLSERDGESSMSKWKVAGIIVLVGAVFIVAWLATRNRGRRD